MHNISDYNNLLTYKSKQRNMDVDMESYWDSRAEGFSNTQNNQKEELPSKVINHLIENNLLKRNSKVLDICGGSGRYAIPMAKVAEKVTVTDISSNMLEYAQLNAEKEELDNLEYVKLDLDKANIGEMGWYKNFDLVFASMCPAIRNEDGLDKMIEASKGSCYIGQYIERTDNISENIMKELHISDTKDPHNDRDSVYGIFNMLWLKGYNPMINYVKEETEEKITLEEIKETYGKRYASLAKEQDKDLDKIILDLGKGTTLSKKRTLAIIHWEVK